MDKDILNNAKKFVNEHLQKEFSLDDVSHFVGYSTYHFAREFKEATGKTIMEYVREERITAASKEIAKGENICETALRYCFDTHSGFTKAFVALFGCTPKEYASHALRSIPKGKIIMEKSKIVVRPICKDDVQDLWENVFSAMTPRQITEVKILPSIEKENRREGIHLVAQVDGKVVMSLPMDKPFGLPLGFLFDNNYILTGGDEDIIMGRIIEEMKRQCRMMNISALMSPQHEGSENVKAFMHFGFTEAFRAGGWIYLMMEV